MADTTTTRPYGRTRRTCPDRAGWAGLCARYEVLAARMGMAATEAGGHCSEYYFILVRPRRPRCDDACRAKLCAPHQTVRSCFAAQTEHELAWKVQSAFRVLASSASCAVRYILLRFIFLPALHARVCRRRLVGAASVGDGRGAAGGDGCPLPSEGCDWRGPGSCPWLPMLARFPRTSTLQRADGSWALGVMASLQT